MIILFDKSERVATGSSIASTFIVGSSYWERLRFVTTSEKKLLRVSDISETVSSFSTRIMLSLLIPLSLKYGLIVFQNV